jgi:hypothetical protein
MITFGFSTKKIDENFISHVKKTSGIKNIEIIPIENDGSKSLTKVYNEILHKAKYDIICFSHDDIEFTTNNWGRKVIKCFNKTNYGIIGFAGTSKLISGKWWEVPETSYKNVIHKINGNLEKVFYSSPTYTDIIDTCILDGLCFFVNKNKIKKNFDESFDGFHFYDIDFTFNNYINGVRIGCFTKIDIIHKSLGNPNEEWEKNKRKFEEKYKEYLPIDMDIDIFVENKKINIKNKKSISILSYISKEFDENKINDFISNIIDKTNYEKYNIFLGIHNSIDIDKLQKNDKLNIIEYNDENEYEFYNSTISKIDSEYILFTSPKINFLNDVVSIIMYNIEKINKPVGIISPRVHFKDNNICYSGEYLRIINAKNNILLLNLMYGFGSKYYYYHYNKETLFVDSPIFLMKKDLFKKLNGFELELNKDITIKHDISLRTINNGYVNYVCGEAVAKYNEDFGKIKSYKSNIINSNEYKDKIIKRCSVNILIAKYVFGASKKIIQNIMLNTIKNINEKMKS